MACGLPAGTPMVLGAPLRQVLPVSPLALSTVMPEAASEASTLSMLLRSAAEVWSSQ